MTKWLKDILQETYSEEIDAQIAREIARLYVPCEKLTESQTKRKEETDALKAQIASMKKTGAVCDALRQLGAIDPQYIIYRQGGIDAFRFDEAGRPLGLDELAAQYRHGSDTAFLFGAEGAVYRPAGGEEAHANPFARETFNLTEQGRLFRRDPAGARRLAAAAHVSLK